MFESEGVPLYIRIKDILFQRILTLTYEDKLPGELQLAGEFKVARGTIKQAIDSLVSIDMVYREQGKGTFINRDALNKYYTDLPDVMTDFKASTPVEVEVISLLPIMASQEVADKMQLALGSQLMRLERVLIQQNKTVGHVLTYLNGKIFSDLSRIDGQRPLYEQLREVFGCSPARATEHYRPVNCDSKLAQRLDIEPGWPLFHIERITRNLDDVVLEYSITHTLDASLSLDIATHQNPLNTQWNCHINKEK